MAELSNKQKKEWAGMLYLKENLTQQEIADKVGVSRITVNKWVKTEMWEQRKACLLYTSFNLNRFHFAILILIGNTPERRFPGLFYYSLFPCRRRNGQRQPTS